MRLLVPRFQHIVRPLLLSIYYEKAKEIAAKCAKAISKEIGQDCEIGNNVVKNSIYDGVKAGLDGDKNRKHQK